MLEAYAAYFLEDVSSLSALLAAMVVITLLDETIKLVVLHGQDRGQRWFFLHAAVNCIICIFSIKDILTTLDNPAASMSPTHSWSKIPGGFVAAIHTYHVLRFKLGADDIFHHAAFAGIGCGSNYIVNYGPIANFYFFFVCGLPGGIDYFLLGLVKNGQLAPMEEKRINSTINLWLRGPGLTMVFSFAFAAFRTGNHGVNFIVVATLAFISLANGQYYLGRVVANYNFKLGQQQSSSGDSQQNKDGKKSAGSSAAEGKGKVE
jgi:hypothetical protein